MISKLSNGSCQINVWFFCFLKYLLTFGVLFAHHRMQICANKKFWIFEETNRTVGIFLCFLSLCPQVSVYYFFFVLSRWVSNLRKTWWTRILQKIINLSQFLYSRWNASFCSGLMFYSIRLSLGISQPSFSTYSKKPKIDVRKVKLCLSYVHSGTLWSLSKWFQILKIIALTM